MIARQRNQQEAWEDIKADYAAAKRGRFRRRRTGIAPLGSGADYHYRVEGDFLRIMEYARDMDRNDAIVGQMVDRAVQNIIQNGLTPDPKTGDDGLNQAIKDRWNDWAGDAQQCSIDGELNYRDLEKLALRQMFVDGDDFTVHTEEGSLQLIEAHRCRRPQRTTQNVVHGVMLDDNRKRLEYWFTKDEVDPMMVVARVSDMEKYPAFDEDKNRLVLHLRNPKRSTQTRGVSAFAPMFDLCGMHEDLQFAKLVQQQIASCIAIIRNRAADFKGGNIAPLGPQRQELWDSAKRLVEELAPGAELRGLPGETITGFSPNIPNTEFFQQMRMTLQLIGINLGMPLVLLLMDASDTNFSGWRGAMDQARAGFRDMQQHMIDHWECHNYLWKLRDFAKEDAAIRAAMPAAMGGGNKNSGGAGAIKLFKHEWNAPRWPYIQPLQDAQADQLQQQALLKSPRQIHQGRGGDWNDTIDETVEDNTYAVQKAAEAAKKLSTTIGERVSWRELLFLTDPAMLKAVVRSGEVGDGQGGGGGTGSGGTPAPQPLNGLQITAAVDVLGKVRAGTIAPEAATQLMIGMGIAEANAKAMITATKAGEGAGAEAVDYARKVVLAFTTNPTLAPLLLNAINLGPTVKTAGLDQNTEYKEPYLPVLAPAGTPVSGGTLKDAGGDIVGGETVGENPKAGADGAVPDAGGGDPNDPNAERGTPNDETKPAGEDPADAPKPEEASSSAHAIRSRPRGAGGGGVRLGEERDDGSSDPEDDPRDPEDKPAKEDA